MGVAPSRCEMGASMFVSERSPRRHLPTLIGRHVRPARRAALSADGSLQPVLRPFVQEDPPRSIRRPARSLLASELNPLTRDTEENPVTLGTILLIVLVLMLVGAFPRWSHSRNWGYAPSGGLGLVLVVVVLLLMGRI